MTGHRRLSSLLVGVLAAATLTACGAGDDPAEGAEGQAVEHESDATGTEAVDQSVCRADATAATDATDAGFPEQWVFPPATTVYDREDREGVGVILTAVSETPFPDILDFLNHDEVRAGFEITKGETEEDDAEADWASADWTGRWTIRKSETCPGETVLQVFAAPR